MALNRLQPGTPCTVRSTGQTGVIKQIYFYPTKYEIEFPDGKILHLSSKDLEIDGIQQNPVLRKTSSVPENGIGESWSTWSPFKYNSEITHHYKTTKAIMWDMLTSLELYNIWFYGIQRTLPVNDTERYVHRYSFDHFEIKPGNYFKMRPKTIAPWFKCRILTVEKEQKFGFTFQTNPMFEEYIEFTIQESDSGIWLKCSRRAEGLFSIMCEMNWKEKSKTLQNLDSLLPRVLSGDSKDDITSDGKLQASQISDSLSKDDTVAFLVNKGLDGDMDVINNHPDKVIRGKAKAMIVKIKRGSVERPKMPEISASNAPTSESGGFDALSNDDKVAFLVNKGMDGDMDIVNNHTDKVIRGKAKAMIVKIKRGSVERPKMPETSDDKSSKPEENNSGHQKTDEEIFEELLAKGLNDEMDEINALDNKVLRGKIKAAIVKAKRSAK